MNTALQLAAVDLGSNSFRLEIGRAEGEQIYILDSMRSNTRLAAGLTQNKLLSDEAQARGLEALAQFAQRLRGFDPSFVRVVATNTLRVAKNAAAFISQAEKVLGFPIEVIAGREEARLIFSGVAHSSPEPRLRQLVVDIGGGSTEFSVGLGFEPEVMESLYMGSINYTMTHFPGGFIDEYSMKQAELAARRELQVIAAGIRASGWEVAIASSGTARSIARILEENKIGDGEITPAGMRWVRKAILCAENIGDLQIAGLKADRALNLPGGFAILSAVFSEFDVASVKIADNSLRLGVLYDQLARISAPFGPQDKREYTVVQFEQRYHVDAQQSKRVAGLAARFARDLGTALGNDARNITCYVDWAARLHETGLTIAHNGYHKHSAYILENADMPGFSRDEQRRLAFLVLGHTGKLPKLARGEPASQNTWMAVACLRLAVLFHRSRVDLRLPKLHLTFDGKTLTLGIDAAWLKKQPLTGYSIEQEVQSWDALGDARPFRFALAHIEATAA